MFRVRFVIAATALVAAGCKPAAPPPLTEQQRTAIVDSVRSVANELATWMSSQGAGRQYASFFDSTAALVIAADGRIVAASHDSVVSRYQGWTPPAGARLTWDSLRIEPLGPGLAHLVGAFKESFTPPSGPAYEGHGVMSAVVVHRPAGWRFAAVHTSVVPQQAGR
jgi:ABC-type amino acid transport substrate-binding protein